MTKFIIFLWLCLTCTLGYTNPLYTIYTGTPKSTYKTIGDDIANVCPNFQVETTQGSLDNINALISEPIIKTGYRFALVQEDVLETILATRTVRLSVKRVRNLYKEEILLIVNAKTNINSVSDLYNRSVAVGTPGSGIWFTANKIRAQQKVSWQANEKSVEENILAVLLGQVDAMFFVGGSPNRILDELGPKNQERIRLIPITSPTYSNTVVTSDNYLWVTYNVPTITTSAVLIAAGDVPESAINDVMGCISKQLPKLRKTGHKKWAEVK